MKKIILILLLLICLTSINSQKNYVDSLRLKLSIETEDSIKLQIYEKFMNQVSDTLPNKSDYLREGLQLALKMQDEEAISNFYYYLAWDNMNHIDLNQAIQNLIKSTQYKGNTENHIYAYGIISNIYSWKGEHKLALEYAEKSLALARSDTNKIRPTVLADAWAYVGDAHRYNKDMEKARPYYWEALSVLHKKGDEHSSMTTASLYVYLAERAFDMNNTMDFSFRVKQLYEISNEEQKRRYAMSMYKVAEAYATLKEAETDKERQIWIYSSGLIILLIITGFLIWQNYARKKMNAKLVALNEELDQANQVKANILGIWNHDLRHPIARLVNYLQLKKMSPEAIDPKIAEEIDQQTMQMANNLLQNMEELLVWCKDQMKIFKPVFKETEVSSIFDSMKSFFSYEQNTTIEFHNPDNLSIITDEDYIKVIIRNLTTNAIKAQAGVEKPYIIWSTSKENGRTVLSIQDHGKGISQKGINMFYQSDAEIPVREGLGLQIIRDLSKTLGCEVELYSTPEEGTMFRLIF